ncbi:chromate transporter [Kinneretia asaccharophila]|uniref:Chromate transporter n=1 Tax=Roseateles asaccharophilus TaxID=582607 RepID=A0A4R6MX61_9BURK|nr:chromate transporter [Roseateles asaccharophilus]MDN3545844.1 chromate transporter [Roseateles asaccharophilus]TDP06699.1 chromate transporter [Roseateles asaccharophilus]
MSEARPAPESLSALFWAFNRLALQGFGGVLAVAQRELVERLGWLSRDDFLEMLAIGQVLPGPNIVNLSLMIGDRFFGLRGALTALAGMLAIPCVIVLALASLSGALLEYERMAGALRGMGAVAAGLVLATGLKLLPSLRHNPVGRAWALLLALGAFAAVALARLPLIWVVLGLSGLGMALALWRLRTREGGDR